MLRVIPSTSASAAKNYHRQSLSREDYYAEGQEIKGEWHGVGAVKLELSGPVTQQAFDTLCDNKRPGSDERLTQRNVDRRTVGYDFNFHCPKSVSVVYEFTKDERILKAFRLSVNQTMQELESEAKTRVRKNGADENRTTGNLIWADFVHFTARPVNGVPDPHLHAHCYVFNATWDEVEKQWKAGQFRDLKANAPYFEAAFHVRFARNLKEIGFKIERTPKGWELHGVPERVLQEFSKRSEQVEKRADELGITTAKKKDGLAALTRERKQKDMTKAELRDSWFQRVSSDERLAILNAINPSLSDAPRISESKAMDFAIEHCYERASITTDKELLRQAYRYGVGDVEVEMAKLQLLREEFIKERADGNVWFTTKEVLSEEQRLIRFVQCGQSQFTSFAESHDFQNNQLSDEQRKAVLHVLQSKDRVIAVRGGAGTGKTTMMKEAVAAIESTGVKVFTFAPSAEAARGVLRSEAGFANAETVEMLLQSSALQKQIRGQVIWIDEAGLLSVRKLTRVADLAERENCRVVLSGDTAQHRAVERGDALRILENHAGLVAAQLTKIRRQKTDAHKAVIADLRSGNLEKALERLEALGMLRELPYESRHQVLADDYVAAIKRGKSALVISPTHSEGEQVTQQIRTRLKAEGKLKVAEREILQLKNLQWTQAERTDTRNYKPGMIVQFHQNATGFRRGERVTVREAVGDQVAVARDNSQAALLDLTNAARFHVYEEGRLPLAPGDMIRITQNGFTKNGKRLNNGDLRQVKGFTKEGDIKLSNDWVVSGDYGNLAHGYCVTSHSAQSKGVDCVFVAEGSESFRAAGREQFYVSASRFKEAMTIYTDDKCALLEAVNKSSQRPAATDLLKQQVASAGLPAGDFLKVGPSPEAPTIQVAASQQPGTANEQTASPIREDTEAASQADMRQTRATRITRLSASQRLASPIEDARLKQQQQRRSGGIHQ